MNSRKENDAKAINKGKPSLKPKPKVLDGEQVKICKFEELNNQYKILREIGRGSYGVVFKGI